MNVVTNNVEEILSNVQQAKPHLHSINDSFTGNISVELGRLKNETTGIFLRHKNESVSFSKELKAGIFHNYFYA